LRTFCLHRVVCARVLFCILPLLFVTLAPAARAAVTAELQRAIRDGTFEVVMKKPEKDPITYEKPLPLDLLPYTERTDAYRSIGTAFALGANTYVTAAHVIAAGIASQFGPPALRRTDGSVVEIDRILKFSMHEDFVVFSLRKDPGPVGFAIDREPKLDDQVLAVGNALGEGIVIRDGLFTSETPEDQDGKWKWIRFSAAASPGNSGGPLLDADGKVIGIVIGKSPNENLNYSLPIGRVLDAPAGMARFDQRVLVGMPYMTSTYTYNYQDQFKLPLPWPEFVSAYQAVVSRHDEEARAALFTKYRDGLFPAGPGSDDLLFAPDANEFRPRVITQQADDTWNAARLSFAKTELPGDGSVSVGTTPGTALVKIVRPDASADDAFYSDSKGFMDLALKALNLRRAVGQDQVRVISLGPAVREGRYTDAYGRKWQERVWAVPFLDSYIVGLALPTPDGYAAVLMQSASMLLPETEVRLRLLAGQVDVSYRGSLQQWRAFLRRSADLPDSLAKMSLASAPNWTLQTARFRFAVPATVLSLSDKSTLAVTMGFMRDGARTLWDVQDVWWYENDRQEKGLGLSRRGRPPANAKIELRNRFENMQERHSPFDGVLNRQAGESYIASEVLRVPGPSQGSVATDRLYAMTVLLSGHPAASAAQSALDSAVAATSITEIGTATASAPASLVVPSPSIPLSRTDGTPQGRSSQSPYAVATDTIISAVKQETASAGLDNTRDIRGRRVVDDVRDFLVEVETDAATAALRGADPETWRRQKMQAFRDLRAYWRNYPALTHSRDLWTDFLAFNRLPATTPHEPLVAQAEAALDEVLQKGPPYDQWAACAQDLLRAYLDERNRLVRRSNLALEDYRPRTTPCPPPATRTSGSPSPKYDVMPRSLDDFWPESSKRLGEQGTVIVSVRIDPNGCATGAAVVGSSGSHWLDNTVLEFYETINFLPAERNGTAVESQIRMPITFKLKD